MTAVMEYEITGDLMTLARRQATALRSFAAQYKDEEQRAIKLRQAAVIEELVRYAQDRDKEIARLVREAALLRARIEERDIAVKVREVKLPDPDWEF